MAMRCDLLRMGLTQGRSNQTGCRAGATFPPTLTLPRKGGGDSYGVEALLQTFRRDGVWRLLLGFGLLLGLVSCGPGPNRVEILKHKKEVMSARQDKDRFFKSSPQSPLLDDQQWRFKALEYYPVDYAYRVTARFHSLPKPVEFRIQTSTGHERVYTTLGQLDFTLKGKAATLFAYQEKGNEAAPTNSLFVPFTDLTSGHESYGAGRYLEMERPAAGEAVVMDFNLAYNPYCAYNYNFSCPIPPPENHVEVAIKAGEKIFPLGQPTH